MDESPDAAIRAYEEARRHFYEQFPDGLLTPATSLTLKQMNALTHLQQCERRLEESLREQARRRARHAPEWAQQSPFSAPLPND